MAEIGTRVKREGEVDAFFPIIAEASDAFKDSPRGSSGHYG
jgi:hypothetical protein